MVVVMKINKNQDVFEVLYKGDNAEPYLVQNRETLEPLAVAGKLKIVAGKLKIEQVHPDAFNTDGITMH
jgi:hypothetical protein